MINIWGGGQVGDRICKSCKNNIRRARGLKVCINTDEFIKVIQSLFSHAKRTVIKACQIIGIVCKDMYSFKSQAYVPLSVGRSNIPACSHRLPASCLMSAKRRLPMGCYVDVGVGVGR